jgi:C4-dicarboxylate-binding protein DctP
VVSVWLNGPRDISNRGLKPILMPEDLRGVKIRVQAIPVSIATMKTLGANVVAMDWTQVPTALQQGVIDAIEPTPNALVGAGLPEMISQVSRVSYQYSFYLLAANRRWWSGLPADMRQSIQEAVDVATKWNWENTEQDNADAYAKVRALGKRVYDLTDAQRAAWRAAVQPVWKEFGDSLVDAKVMARLREISEKGG